jgi:hypothetical protein
MKVRDKVTVVCIIAVLCVFSGCASHRYVVTMPLKTQLREYSMLEIKDFESYVTGGEAEGVAKEIPDMLLDAITKHNELYPEKRLFSEASRSTNKSDGVLVVKGTLLSYEKGSRAKRYFIGFGAGKAYSTVKCTFIDKSTGEQVLEATFDGELSIGVFGGEAKRAYEGVVKAIVDYFNDNY